jgi:putative hydrolase of the HAD superfamily
MVSKELRLLNPFASIIFAAMPQAHAKAPPAPVFRGIDTWIFDLDHTLYTLDAVQQAAMEERICVFVQRHFDIARVPAWEIQKRYLKDYGTTLGGLMRHHGVDPETYHAAVNDLDALGLESGAALRAGLSRLPGKRLVFTNNCGRFARGVLERLGVADLFGDIVDARALNYVPKPDPAAYDALVARGGFDPCRAVLFDDSMRNLVPARALGMRTVWFNNGMGQSHWRVAEPELHIDHETGDRAAFLQSIRIVP